MIWLFDTTTISLFWGIYMPIWFCSRTQINFTVAVDFTASNGNKMIDSCDKHFSSLQLINTIQSSTLLYSYRRAKTQPARPRDELSNHEASTLTCKELCKCIGKRKCLIHKKRVNSHRIGLVRKHSFCFIALEHQWGCRTRVVMWKCSMELVLPHCHTT